MDAIKFDTERYLVDIDRSENRESGGGLFEALLREDQARYEHLPEHTQEPHAAASDWQESQRAFVETQQRHAETYRRHQADERQFEEDRRDALAAKREEISERHQKARPDRVNEEPESPSAFVDDAPPAARDKPAAENTANSKGSNDATEPEQTASGVEAQNGASNPDKQPKDQQAAANTVADPSRVVEEEKTQPVAAPEPEAKPVAVEMVQPVVAPPPVTPPKAPEASNVSETPAAAVVSPAVGGQVSTPMSNQPLAQPKPQSATGAPATATTKPSDTVKAEPVKLEVANKPADTGPAFAARVTVNTPAVTSQPSASLSATATMAVINADAESSGKLQSAANNGNAQARAIETGNGLEKAVADSAKSNAKNQNGAQYKSGSGNSSAAQQAAMSGKTAAPVRAGAGFEPLPPLPQTGADLATNLSSGNGMSSGFNPISTAMPQSLGSTTASAELQARAQSASASPSDQVAVQIQKGLAAGKDKISVRLSPAELGRIDINMELADDGRLRAVVTAERPETLELLQRDSRALERALQDAGVKTDSGSLSFNGRGNRQQGDFAGGADGQMASAAGNGDAGDAEGLSESAIAAQQMSFHDGNLDIRV